jgi:hypothetical protein
MRALWLCAIILAAWPRIGFAKGLFGNENATIPLNDPPERALRGYYIRMSPLSLLHAGFGLGMPINPRPATPEQPAQTFGPTGVQLGWNRSGNIEQTSLLVTPQIGYTLMADPERYVHLARLGLGIGLGNNWAAVHYLPRFVVGASAGQLAFGARHSITVSFVSNLLAVEAGHQLLYINPQLEHDLYFTVSANLLIVVYVLSFLR